MERKIRDLLVGSTGFVGSNLILKHDFWGCCHSLNVGNYYDAGPDLCVYAGVPSMMFIANDNPEEDYHIMENARENLRKICPKKTVLISTIAVYDKAAGLYENDDIVTENLTAYGRNRLQLEEWVKEDFDDTHIIRLPALYGVHMKKNFIYDIHEMIPYMLTRERYEILCGDAPGIGKCYREGKKDYYIFENLNSDKGKKEVRTFFEGYKFNALSFTDHRSKYQFYNLDRLWADIRIAVRKGIRTANLFPEPVSAKEVYSAYKGNDGWNNILPVKPYSYDLYTMHAGAFGGEGNYIMDKDAVLDDLLFFLRSWKHED